MHAVICATGLDGLALAMTLGQGGWTVLVLRADWPRKARSGYLVELGEEALGAAQQMGILREVLKSAECAARVRWVDFRGKPIADVNVGYEIGGTSVEPIYVMREDLERILLQNLPANVQVRTGTLVNEVRTGPEGVALSLSSGDSLQTDLLVGADGGKSRVRDVVFGGDGVWRRPLGHHSAAFVFRDIAIHNELAGNFTVLSAPGRLVALCPLRDARVAATFAFRTVSSVRPKTPASWLKSVFGDLKWCVPAVLEHAKNATELHYDRATQIKATSLYRARVALLGDACHTYTLLPGHGRSAAIAAAFWLGNQLVRGAPFESAFEWYDAQWAQEIAARRATAKRMASWLMPESRRELALRNGLLRMSSVPGIRRFVKPTVSLAT